MRKILQIPFFLFAALIAGCAGYQKGSLPNSETASLYLEPIQNEAYISGVAPLFQSELRRQILSSRLLKLVPTPEEADMVAYIRLLDYEEQPIGYLKSDTGQPISARISVSAQLTLTETDIDETVLIEDMPLTANSAVYSSPSTAFPNPVDQSKPAMVSDLARRVVLELELQRP